MKNTGVIILNYNNIEDTINCIKSVEKHNTTKIKYIIIDNGSTRLDAVDKLNLFLIDLFSDDYQMINDNDNQTINLLYCNFIVSKKNDGYAVGNNKGLRFAYNDDTIDKILILNNDILFIEDIIPTLGNYIEKNSKVGIVSPLLLKKDALSIDYNCARKNATIKEIISHFLFFYFDPFNIKKDLQKRERYILKNNPNLLNQEEIEIELPSGSCMLINKEFFQKIGGFDPNTFLYYEENILFKKTLLEKKKNYLLPQLKCIHLGAVSTTQTPGAFVAIASLKSAAYYLEKYEKIAWGTRVLLHIIKFIFIISVNIQKKIKLTRKRTL